MHSPFEVHMETVYQILKYSKRAPSRSLFFKKNVRRNIEAFTNADWAGSIDDKRSTLRYYKFVWGNLVTWRSKKNLWWLEAI